LSPHPVSQISASSQKPQTRTFKKVISGFSKKNLSLIVQDEVYPGNVEAI